jgi:hypothetical protein
MDSKRWTPHPEVSYTLDALTSEEREFLLDYVTNNFIATKTINHRHTAYGLKQRFTREHFFITQEQFIEAMRTVGYGVELIEGGDAYFAISENSPHLQL